MQKHPSGNIIKMMENRVGGDAHIAPYKKDNLNITQVGRCGHRPLRNNSRFFIMILTNRGAFANKKHIGFHFLT